MTDFLFDYEYIPKKVNHGLQRETGGYFWQCVDQVLTKNTIGLYPNVCGHIWAMTKFPGI